MITLVMPAYNEDAVIEESVRRVSRLVSRSFPDGQIRVVDNASTDKTPSMIDRLGDHLENVEAIHLQKQGKARAIRRGWRDVETPVLGFIDADLSPDPAYIPMLADRVSRQSGLALGSRHLPGSQLEWSSDRVFLSRMYNRLIRVATGSKIRDHQCGLKMVDAEFFRRIEYDLFSTEWFLDTELILHAYRLGAEISEHPIRWIDKPDSKVSPVGTTAALCRGLVRFGREWGLGRWELGVGSWGD